MLKIDPN